jgi:hypothetical protein
VTQRIFVLAARRALVAHAHSDRHVTAATKRASGRSGAFEYALHDIDVRITSIVRRAGDRELAFAESESVERAGSDERKRLERLRRGTQRKTLVRVAEAVRELTAFVHDGDGRGVHGVRHRPANHARSNGIP